MYDWWRNVGGGGKVSCCWFYPSFTLADTDGVDTVEIPVPLLHLHLALKAIKHLSIKCKLQSRFVVQNGWNAKFVSAGLWRTEAGLIKAARIIWDHENHTGTKSNFTLKLEVDQLKTILQTGGCDTAVVSEKGFQSAKNKFCAWQTDLL